MTLYALNGSPRKNYNTAQLLDSFKKGAESVGENSIDVRVVNLYDYTFTGCRECYLCKLKGGKSFGKCGFRDSITDLLDAVVRSDGFVIGAPIFFGDFNAQTKSFIERLMFPFLSYDGKPSSAPQIPTAIFSAMNVPETTMESMYRNQINNTLNLFGYIFGSAPETCFATNTYQFSDYSKFAASMWNEPEKKQWHEEQFPKDCNKAFEIGRAMAEKTMSTRGTKG